MKNSISMVLLFFLVAFTGCERLIDITPENSLTFRNGLETETDINSALAAAGQYALSIPLFGVTQNGLFADEVNQSGGWEPTIENIQELSWNAQYTLIAQANVVLHFIDQVDISDERKNLYKGQALFYKALAYYDLITRFGDCVLIKDDVEIDPQPKSSWVEIATYAIALAQSASELLPEHADVINIQKKTLQNKSVPCRGAAHALLAYLAAWKAAGKYFANEGSDYDENELWVLTESACSAIVNSGVYALAVDPETVCEVVMTGGSEESIFENAYKDFWEDFSPDFWRAQIVLANNYQTWPVVPNASPFDIQNKELRIKNSTVNRLFQEGDLRKHAYFYNFDELSQPDNLPVSGGFAYPYKWRRIMVGTDGWEAGQFINYNVNRIWWRLADIILLRAEARNNLGNSEGAIADLNIIRARASAPLYHANEYGGDLKYTIFKEREKEMLMEHYRYFDVVRNGYVRQELKGRFPTTSDQDIRDGAIFAPISSSEFTRNPLMRQNKYWSKYL